jgi:drug/metabolite transporter (DMT)-like permease
MTARRPGLGYALVVIAAGLFIVNAGVSRVVLRSGIDPATLTSLRITGALAVFVLWALVLQPSALRPPRGRELALVVALGAIGVAALQWTYFVAVDRLPVGVALLLEYTAPVLVALWARLVRRESVRRRMWVAIVLSLAGLAAVAQVWDGLTLDALGVAAGLGAAVSFAAYFLLGETGVSALDPLRVNVWAFGIAAVLMNLLAPVTGLRDTGASTSLLGSLAALSAPVWVLLGWVVVLGTVAPYALELYALRHLAATVVVVVAMLEPIGAVVLGWAWFGEGLSGVQLLGCGAVLAGILLAQTARVHPAPEAAPIS